MFATPLQRVSIAMYGGPRNSLQMSKKFGKIHDCKVSNEFMFLQLLLDKDGAIQRKRPLHGFRSKHD